MTAPFRALGLGPVSVKPHRQREGIGNQLVRMGLEQAREGGWQGVFVVGDPKFYARFGFEPALAMGFTSRYSGPHLMALALGRELPTREGVIGYASAFESLGLVSGCPLRSFDLNPRIGCASRLPSVWVDLFALRLRPNYRRNRAHVSRASADLRRRWPGVVIDNGLQDAR